MYKKMVQKAKNGLIVAEDIIHLVVAVLLLLAVVSVVILTMEPLKHGFTMHTVLSLINSALLILIIKEVLWSVIKFLGRQEFSIKSFLYIGIISGIRKLLFAEASMSSGENHGSYMLLLENGVTALITFLLVVGYYLIRKSESFPIEKEK